jgi:hypothetical protein
MHFGEQIALMQPADETQLEWYVAPAGLQQHDQPMPYAQAEQHRTCLVCCDRGEAWHLQSMTAQQTTYGKSVMVDFLPVFFHCAVHLVTCRLPCAAQLQQQLVLKGAAPAVCCCRWQSVRIDGGTSIDERQTIVDNFNCRGVGQVRAAAQAGFEYHNNRRYKQELQLYLTRLSGDINNRIQKRQCQDKAGAGITYVGAQLSKGLHM